MKTISILIISLFFASTVFASKAITGDSNSFLDDYQITNVSENTYELTYSNSTEKFTIEVCPKEAECCYLVRNNHFEVMYLCNGAGFGLRKMPDKDQSMSTAQYCKLVDCKAFKYQSLLTPKKKNTKSALGLIACFLPYVVNEPSRELVFNPTNTKLPKLAEEL